jgi:hypothetical protein
VRTGRSVASQHIIPVQLFWREEQSLRHMRAEVYGAQLPVQGGNVSHQRLYLGLGNGTCGEQRLQVVFSVNELLAQAHGLRPHILKEGLRVLALFRRQLQLVCKVEDVSGTGVMIQLCRLC